MIKILFVDDDGKSSRNSLDWLPQEWLQNGDSMTQIDVAISFAQAQEMIVNQPPYDFISLDHDLGELNSQGEADEDKTGYALVKWLGNEMLEKWPKKGIRCHSMNPLGRKNIEGFIQNVQKHLLGEMK